ncbi:uncharacterized protein LOC129568159 [Sitodiplosis mosellana]|uniref:uncharacterized protein LOC129568159 n=1 Tax=Sitodiplosis mosellana TaxID=263140 RepID=UPI0024451163|nr:uncharacterized protein LOC129568159 [Sitodiplosis mosellana]
MRPLRRKRSKQNVSDSSSSSSPSGSQSLDLNNGPIPPKSPRLDEIAPPPAVSNTHFLDINDDCIDSICNLLPLDDLCSMGRTCKRLHCIAGDYFQRYYPNNHVRIQSFRRRSVFYMYPDEKYVEDLKPFIRNVSIHEYKGSACVKYLKENFSVNLREIALHGIHCELNAAHGAQIKDQLERLESIKFVNCSVGDIYDCFLKHCQKLKHLGIDEPIQFNGRVNWAQQHFPTLESIAYYDEANTNRADFAGFLRRNPQIKQIACKGTNIQGIVFQRAKNLDFLILCYNSDKDFNRIFKLLKVYSENSETRHIKLEFKKRLELDHFHKIASIQRVDAYRGYLVENLQFPEIVASMKQLSVVQLRSFGNVSQVYVKRLASSLSNLEELHFTAQDMALSFKNLIIPFCQNPKLKKIVIFSKQIIYRCTKSDVADINKVREPLDTESKLTIYMEKEVIVSMNFKIPDKCKVTLKPLSELKREVHLFDL